MRHLFIINPSSFRELSTFKKVMLDIENCFTTTNRDDYYMYISRFPRDAVAVINRYIESGAAGGETTRVYAVGGDGILLDCLNGVVGNDNAELTCMPYGTNCDFLRCYGDGGVADFRDLRNLINGETRGTDVIKCGASYVLNNIGFGTGALANAAMRNMRDKHGSFARWQISVLHKIGIYGTMISRSAVKHYKIDIDGKDYSGTYVNIGIFNGQCSSGYLRPCPEAAPDDGEMNVVLVKPMGVAAEIWDYRSYGKKGAVRGQNASHVPCKKITISADEIIKTSMDSEVFSAKTVEAELIKNAIKFVYPHNRGKSAKEIKN